MTDNRCIRISDLKQKVRFHPEIGTYIPEEDIDLADRVFCSAETDRDCPYCKNGTYRQSIHQWDGTLVRKVNFCDDCGRDLRNL